MWIICYKNICLFWNNAVGKQELQFPSAWVSNCISKPSLHLHQAAAHREIAHCALDVHHLLYNELGKKDSSKMMRVLSYKRRWVTWLQFLLNCFTIYRPWLFVSFSKIQMCFPGWWSLVRSRFGTLLSLVFRWWCQWLLPFTIRVCKDKRPRVPFS